MKDFKEASLFVLLVITSSSIWLAEATNQTEHEADLTNTTTTVFVGDHEETSPRRISNTVFTVFTSIIVAITAICYGYCIIQMIRIWCCMPEEFDLDAAQRRLVLERIFSETSKAITENTFPKKKKAKPHDGTSVTKAEKNQEEDHPTDIEIPKVTTVVESNEELDDVPLDLEAGSLESPANNQEEEPRDRTDSLGEDEVIMPSSPEFSPSIPFESSSPVPACSLNYSPGCISTQATPQDGSIFRIRRTFSWQKPTEEYDEEAAAPSNLNTMSTVLGQEEEQQEKDHEEEEEEEEAPSKIAAVAVSPARSLDEDDDDDDSDENVCAICISGYRPGEVVVSSKYCDHIFHKECILEWLEKHEMCPCCRVDMVTNTDINKAAVKVVGQRRIVKAVQSLRSPRQHFTPPASPEQRTPRRQAPRTRRGNNNGNHQS